MKKAVIGMGVGICLIFILLLGFLWNPKDHTISEKTTQNDVVTTEKEDREEQLEEKESEVIKVELPEEEDTDTNTHPVYKYEGNNVHFSSSDNSSGQSQYRPNQPNTGGGQSSNNGETLPQNPGNDDGNKDDATEDGTLTAEDIEDALKDDNTIVVDARHNDIYSGWALEGLERGGHIPGAIDFAASNLTCIYDENNQEGLTREEYLAEMMKNKGISPDKKIIIYDTNGKDAKLVAEYFKKQGIQDISIYDANEWVDDSSRKLESYDNYEMLVPASIVKEIVEGNVPEGFTDCEEIKIIDIRWGDNWSSGYANEHIPTAVHVNTDDFEPPVDKGGGVWDYRLADDEALEQLALKTGITADDCVIMTSPEPMAANRYAVICKYLGVEDVRVLSCGFISWVSAGYELEEGVNNPIPETEFGKEVPANQDWIDTVAETQEFLAENPNQETYTLVDNRTIEEFNGEWSGYSYHKIAGRIPGAVYGMAGINSSNSVYYYRNVDKSMRNPEEILSMWENECGIDTTTRMAFMCGGGWRAAEIFWDARVMGLDNTSLFSDGWCAWSNDGLPYYKGDEYVPGNQ